MLQRTPAKVSHVIRTLAKSGKPAARLAQCAPLPRRCQPAFFSLEPILGRVSVRAPACSTRRHRPSRLARVAIALCASKEMVTMKEILDKLGIEAVNPGTWLGNEF